MRSIALIDYKAGNLTSVRKALGAVGAAVFTPETPDEIQNASGIIVPGVGHFAATRALDGGWVRAIRQAIERGRPLLGICLGMQWLYEGSDEAPDLPGLGVLKGRAYRLGQKRAADISGLPRVKIPHVGWNTLRLQRTASIVAGVADESPVYFTHSFVAPVTEETVASTDHGETFASVVQAGIVAGVQFHPEKSGDVGLTILRNFIALTAREDLTRAG
jgi:glutamine amidotransferase